jgi:serine/threonine protein kinase/Tfp pilus assembly protein PilF
VSDNHHDDDKTQTHIPLLKDTVVGHYRIVEKIGAGGMGEVYLAEDTELDRKVALKFLPPHLCQDEDCRKRFKREAQAAAKLSHPNIVTIHEVGEHQTRPYFVMEHIEGRSLRDVKAEELDIDRIVGIAIQLCDGLHSAHTAGVIHRDIKPSNIIIDSSGRPKLLDFGLATVKGGEHLTRTGSTLGTVGYMSPEQIEGKATDARSDLFSLGVVLYELIANKSPFRRDDETATLKAILQDTPEPLARYKSDVPDDLQRVVTKLLEKDPRLRYQSAAGVIPDLKKLSAASTASVVMERKRSLWSRYVVPSAVIILLAVVAIWYFGYRDQAPSTTADDDRIMLAVLPFENLGDPKDEYFADGMTEEIISRLTSVQSLGVIVRSSVMRYKDSDKSNSEIASELGVNHILRGTIRWDKTGDTNLVRITPQLIDIVTNTNIWAENYERAMTGIFGVQVEIGEKIVYALDLRLSVHEQDAISSSATDDIEAFNAFLAAREIYSDPEQTWEDWKAALRLLYRAVTLDTGFAEAYALLSNVHSSIHHYGYDHSEKRLDSAYSAAHKSLTIDPDLSEGHLAMAWYHYRAHRDYDRAFRSLENAKRSKPGDADVLYLYGVLFKRTGDFGRALEYLQQTYQLRPKSVDVLIEMAICYELMGQYQKYLSTTERIIRLEPQSPSGYHYASVASQCLGELERALDYLRSYPGPQHSLTETMYFLLEFFKKDSAAVFGRLASGIPLEKDQQTEIYPQALYWGWAHKYLGNTDSARAYFEQALSEIEQHEDTVPDDNRVHLSLANVHAELGHRDTALSRANEALRLWPESKDVMNRQYTLKSLLRMYAALGDTENALGILQELMSLPTIYPTKYHRKDPRLANLYADPRFQALIEKYEKEHGI